MSDASHLRVTRVYRDAVAESIFIADITTRSGATCALILARANHSTPDNAASTFVSESELDYLPSDGQACLLFDNWSYTIYLSFLLW